MKGLSISEHFYSIQGEGITMGVPSVFLRLTACNLLCKGDWICDTIEVWKKGDNYTHDEAMKLFEDNYLELFKKGVHLVLTGGEPVLQQKELEVFLREYYNKHGMMPFVELETNGTKLLNDSFFNLVTLINCSPKLSNSGEPYNKRIKRDVLKQINSHEFSIFKFVITKQQDWEEVQELINKYELKKEKIVLMPGADDEIMLKQNSKMVSDICKDNQILYSSRLQIEIWNKTTGV